MHKNFSELYLLSLFNLKLKIFIWIYSRRNFIFNLFKILLFIFKYLHNEIKQHESQVNATNVSLFY